MKLIAKASLGKPKTKLAIAKEKRYSEDNFDYGKHTVTSLRDMAGQPHVRGVATSSSSSSSEDWDKRGLQIT